MTNLSDLIDKFSTVRIRVFGDVMLDDFTHGTVSRISPEAPVPVVDAEFTEYRLGGCGNVASNIAALGGEVYLFAVVGDDPYAEKLAALLRDHKIHNMTIKDRTRPTTRKNRIIANRQQVGARIDWEKRHDIFPALEQAIIQNMRYCFDDFDIIVLSDYGKGALTENLCKRIIDTATSADKPIIVDPKAAFSKYKGATVITPNFNELLEYGKIKCDRSPENIFPFAKSIMQENAISYLLVTMGEEGMALFERNKYATIKAVKNGYEIIDVTGAGDTVVGVYALALAAKADHYDAMQLANYAAGIVVTKSGTAVCSSDELRAIVNNTGSQKVVV